MVKSFDVRLDDCLATLKDLLEAERVGICYVMLCYVMLHDIIVHYRRKFRSQTSDNMER